MDTMAEERSTCFSEKDALYLVGHAGTSVPVWSTTMRVVRHFNFVFSYFSTYNNTHGLKHWFMKQNFGGRIYGPCIVCTKQKSEKSLVTALMRWYDPAIICKTITSKPEQIEASVPPTRQSPAPVRLPTDAGKCTAKRWELLLICIAPENLLEGQPYVSHYHIIVHWIHISWFYPN